MNERMQLTAKTFHGLEQVLADEIKAIGGKNIKTNRRVVTFEGDQRVLYRSNYELRTAINILHPIHSFKATTEDQLYKGVQSVNWDDYFSPDQKFAINPTVRSDHFTHSQYAMLKTKDAIVDYFRDKYDRRPSIDKMRPDMFIDLNIRDEKVIISLNSSGEPLFKRAYRRVSGQAPINEILASGLIQMSGWNKQSPFLDPMCGSGTIPLEAALLAANIPSGYFRRFYGFIKWKDFDQELWDDVQEKASANIKNRIPRIVGSDSDMRIIRKARENAERITELVDITFQAQGIQDVKPSEGSMVIFNPPYGERMDHMQDINGYDDLGDIIKNNFKGTTVWIITSDRDAIKHIGLKTSQRINLMNGPLDCTYRKFDVY